MAHLPRGHHEFDNHDDLRQHLALYRECSDDDEFLATNQPELQKLLLHSLNTEAVFHDAVETLIAVMPFAYRQQEQATWQHITWDALIGALNLRDGVLQAKIMNMLARYQMLEGKHELARKNIDNALKRAEEEQNDLTLLWAYIRFFELLVYQPRNFARDQVIHEVLALAERVNQPYSSIALHHSLCHFYVRWGDYERAMGHAQMTYILARKYRERAYLAKAAYQLVGICYRSLNPATKRFLQIAKSTDTSTLHKYELASVIGHESALNYEMGNVAAAAEGYYEMYKLLQNTERPVHLASALHGLALCQIRLKQFSEAQANLERAGELWQKVGSAYEHANFRFTQGFLEAWRGNRRFALKLLKEAFTMTDAIPEMGTREELRSAITATITDVDNNTLEDTYRLEERPVARQSDEPPVAQH